jgi:hypothetical protein
MAQKARHTGEIEGRGGGGATKHGASGGWGQAARWRLGLGGEGGGYR